MCRWIGTQIDPERARRVLIRVIVGGIIVATLVAITAVLFQGDGRVYGQAILLCSTVVIFGAARLACLGLWDGASSARRLAGVSIALWGAASFLSIGMTVTWSDNHGAARVLGAAYTLAVTSIVAAAVAHRQLLPNHEIVRRIALWINFVASSVFVVDILTPPVDNDFGDNGGVLGRLSSAGFLRWPERRWPCSYSVASPHKSARARRQLHRVSMKRPHG